MQWWTVKQLKSRNAQARASAAAKLGREGLLSALEPLAEALADGDAAVRSSAVEALGNLANKEVLPALLPLMKDPEAEVRKAAAKALSKVTDPSVIPVLVEALGDPGGEVAWQAAQSLKALGWTPADDSERAAWHCGMGQFDQAASLGAAAIEPLGKLTRSTSFHRSVRAIEALTQVGGAQVVKFLLECLRNHDSTVRSAAATALGQAGDARAVEPLIETLRDEFPQACLAASISLSKIGDQRAVEPLIEVLAHRSAEVRAAALEALGRLRDPAAVPAILPLLQDGDCAVREGAAGALGLLAVEETIEQLVIALTDAESSVRQAAARALRMIDPYWERSGIALRAIPGLQIALKNKEYWVRYTAADVLNKLGNSQTHSSPLVTEKDGARQKREAAVTILCGLLEDYDRDFRQAAAEALGRLALPQTIPALITRMTDSERGVQVAAARSLETLRWQPKSIPDRAVQLVLLEKWSDAAALGPKAIPALGWCLHWNEPMPRRRALQAIVQIGGPEAIHALEVVAGEPTNPSREEALSALAALGVPLSETVPIHN